MKVKYVLFRITKSTTGRITVSNMDRQKI